MSKGTHMLTKADLGIPWEERVLLTLQHSAQISGLSPSTLYALHHRGQLDLVRLAGRTLVVTTSLKRLLQQTAPWDRTPSMRGMALAQHRRRNPFPVTTQDAPGAADGVGLGATTIGPEPG